LKWQLWTQRFVILPRYKVFGGINMPTTFYTKEEYNKINDYANTIERIIRDFAYHYKNELLNEKCDKNSWNYIPNNDYFDFYKILKKAIKLIGKGDCYNAKFLDAGCGVGITLGIAKSIGFVTTGLELQDKSIKIAKNIFGQTVIKADILKFKKYGDYDLIYFYCPFRGGGKQIEFEKIVADQIKVNAFVLAWDCGHVFEDDKRFKQITFGYNCLFQKVKE
jgi:SAM-dependent methyltransferase